MAKPKLKYSKAQIEKLFVDLYNGVVNPYDLPEDLYKALGNYLMGGVSDGLAKVSISFGEADPELVAKLKENIYLFSGAKTFQQTMEMSDALVDDKGELRSFDEFKNVANEIYTRYNGGDIDDETKPGWLEAEYNTAIAQAANAKKWDKIEREKKIFPYLLYNALGNACEICAPLNGTMLPVDHPFWDQYMPENHFNCLCIVEQVEVDEGEEKETDDDDVEQAVANADIPDNFKFNAGKRNEIFATEGKAQHPYFQVPKEFTKFAKDNFDLSIPDEE